MLTVSRQADVQIVELHHGKVNALDLELLNRIIETFTAAPEGQPIVLTGAGRAFSAGVDLARITSGEPDYVPRFLHALSECFLAVYDHTGPVVAAVNGAAIAGGCVLAAACDRRLISSGPIGLAELTVGVPFPTAALEIMRCLLGERVNDLVLNARSLDADAALAVGLVDEVVEAGELLPRAVRQAQAWAAKPAGVFALTKSQLQAPTRAHIAARATTDDAAVARLWQSSPVHDSIEGFMARLRDARRPVES